MKRELNLDDIQGNVTRAYGRFSFPCARYFFLHINKPEEGRIFLDRLRAKITTAQRWKPNEKPKVTLNVAFAFMGLRMLGVPIETLKGLPAEFISGMKARAFILGDKDNTKLDKEDENWCKDWDPIWKDNRLGGDGKNDVHLWISMNAQVKPGTDQPVDELEEQTEWLRKLCAESNGGVHIIAKNGKQGDQEYQSATAIFKDAQVIRIKEGQTLKTKEGQTLKIKEGQILKIKEGQTLKIKEGQTLKTEDDQAIKIQDGQAIKIQDGQAIKIQDGQAIKIQDGQTITIKDVQTLKIKDGQAIKIKDVQTIRIPTPKEHFGLTDGIGDPVFEGQYAEKDMKDKVVGRGKWMNPTKCKPEEPKAKEPEKSENCWEPLATGEFILGHPDEAQELPETCMPPEYAHNGTFMVYRKLHENVSSFEEVLEQEAESYARVMSVPKEEALETLKAKMVGRWSDGVPLSKVATYKEWQNFRKEKELNDPDAYREYLGSREVSSFRYGDDMAGYKCPVSSHLRRVNTRDSLDPLNKLDVYKPNSENNQKEKEKKKKEENPNPKATTQLNNRRRILRRGLPYGSSELGVGNDDTEQGVIFMTICADIFRQFEFVQQQWIQYGLDFNVGNNTCPLLGNHEHHKRHIIPSDPDTGKPPYIMSKLKTFVEVRGGDYFFIPSMTALRMMAMGIVDPT